MRKTALLTIALSAAFLSGCFSLDHAKSPKTGDEHVLVTNYGWTLFNCIPFACGNATDPQDPGYWGPIAFFRNDLTMEKIQDRMTKYAATHGNKSLTDMVYHNYDTVFISVPGGNIPIPIPYIICYREIQLSGVLK